MGKQSSRTLKQRQMKEGSGGGKRSETDKEKTKMRERQRRAITTNIFHGLRKHGGYRLSPRADINEVLGELAKEAGWVIKPDGTTYRSKPNSTEQVSNSCPLCGALQTTTATTNPRTTSGTVIGGGDGTERSATMLGGALSNINVGSCSLLYIPKSFNGSGRQPISVPMYKYQELSGEALSSDGKGGRNSGDGGFVECSAMAMMTCQQQKEVLRLEAASRPSQRTMVGSPLHHF